MSVSTASKVDWGPNLVMELIKIYKKKQVLYNTKCPLYHNKRARAEALDEITEKISRFVPNITANNIKIKINYIRSQYGRELLRVSRNVVKSGSEPDDIYVPTAYWYEHLHFLKPFMQVRKGKLYNDLERSPSSQSEFDEDPLTSRSQMSSTTFYEPTSAKKEKKDNDYAESLTSHSQMSSTSFDEPTPAKKKKIDHEDSDLVLKSASDFLLKLSDDKPQDDYAESLSLFFKTNLLQITDNNLRDEFSSQIMNLIFLYKRKQCKLNSKV